MADLMGTRMVSPSRPTSSASGRSSSVGDFQLQLDQMQARLDALEHENSQLRANAELSEGDSKRLEALLVEQRHTASKIAELELLVRTTERTVSERESTIEALERAAQQMTLDIEKVKGDAEARVRDIQSKLDDRDALVTNLKDALQTKEGLQSENDAVLRAKDAEIALLEARVQKAYSDLEDERGELGGQVEELRRAGQVRLIMTWLTCTYDPIGNHRIVRGAPECRGHPAVRTRRLGCQPGRTATHAGSAPVSPFRAAPGCLCCGD